MPLEPIGRPSSLADLAYESLHEAILTGSLRVGEKLSVVALSERLGMSRSPLRSAVERLATEGLVRVARDGVEVLELTHSELVDLLAVRSVLEGLASRLATSRIGEPTMSRLDVLQGEFAAAVAEENTSLARSLDLEFHELIRHSSGNVWLMEQLRRLQSRVIATTYSIAWTPRQHEAVAEHQSIVDALRIAQPDQAERAAVAHIENLIDRVRASQAESDHARADGT